VAAPPPNILLVVVFVGADVVEACVPNVGIVSAVFGAPPKMFGPKTPGAGVDPALAVGNTPGEAAVVLSVACDVAAGPNIGFDASPVVVVGLSPPLEELPNSPPVGAAGLFAPKIVGAGVDTAAGVVGGFPKDVFPNSAEAPVAPAPPKAVVGAAANPENVGVLVVGVDARPLAPPKIPDVPPKKPPLVLVEGIDAPACVEAGGPKGEGLLPKRVGFGPNSPPLGVPDDVPDPNDSDDPPAPDPKGPPPWLLDISVALLWGLGVQVIAADRNAYQQSGKQAGFGVLSRWLFPGCRRCLRLFGLRRCFLPGRGFCRDCLHKSTSFIKLHQ